MVMRAIVGSNRCQSRLWLKHSASALLRAAPPTARPCTNAARFAAQNTSSCPAAPAHLQAGPGATPQTPTLTRRAPTSAGSRGKRWANGPGHPAGRATACPSGKPTARLRQGTPFLRRSDGVLPCFAVVFATDAGAGFAHPYAITKGIKTQSSLITAKYAKQESKQVTREQALLAYQL